MRALLTNDDGIDSPGLAALARIAVDAGLDVVVAAPLRESSGTSASLTATEDGEGILVEARTLPELPSVAAHAVAAHPAFVVRVAALGAFGPPPEVVLSGINRGANIGRAVLHSGTVGAALTDALHGARSMAVSLDVGPHPDGSPRWTTVRPVLRAVRPLLLDAPPGTTVNVNVPDRLVEQLAELRRCRLARFGIVQSRVEHLSNCAAGGPCGGGRGAGSRHRRRGARRRAPDTQRNQRRPHRRRASTARPAAVLSAPRPPPASSLPAARRIGELEEAVCAVTLERPAYRRRVFGAGDDRSCDMDGRRWNRQARAQVPTPRPKWARCPPQ